MTGHLQHQWVVAGIVSASARFIPIPFVDDLVQSQCRRFVVARTLANHDTNLTTSQLKPLYSNGGGCLPGCTTLLAKAPLKLLLFPIRKIVAVVTSVRGVPVEIMRMVLLGRTLDRYLKTNRIDPGSGDAAKMRLAFEASFARMDLRVVKAAVADALAGVNGWKKAAVDTAQEIARPRERTSEGLNPSTEVETGARKVEEVLQRPETLTLFADFDQKFDDALERLG
ncbi:hypothetical protein Mal15_07680 [Stieleria maiorica]|uniref:Uncharacterized protein n=1 Tax=Stieleria maiorica TaxID=2795974 RepID=A0A5B9M7P9_9BACT|nr:hypothetical protein [Stieleria maiorica]QEF96739.1 hypothetical protein Mal15_07680 [Stieleria maiorica]